MPTPSERLANIISAYSPSEVVFRAGKPRSGNSFVMDSVITKKLSRTVIANDEALQTALEDSIGESWNSEGGNFYIEATVDGLWGKIRQAILQEYEQVSDRCAATRRKTENFIRSININDKYLPNFLLQTYLTITAEGYERKSRLEQQAIFEQFESLRRTYGKRS